MLNNYRSKMENYIGVVGPNGKIGVIKSYMDERKFEKESDLI